VAKRSNAGGFKASPECFIIILNSDCHTIAIYIGFEMKNDFFMETLDAIRAVKTRNKLSCDTFTDSNTNCSLKTSIFNQNVYK
jgi:hypothetical protein